MENLFDRAVHPLYSVCAFACAFIAFLLLNSSRRNLAVKNNNHELIILWTMLFCIQDGIWGLFASHIIYSPTLLYVSSYGFHFCAITSTLAWSLYFLSRLKGQVAQPKMYVISTALLALIQYVMLIRNVSTKFMFFVDADGFYQTTDYRSIMFYLQLFVYVVMTIVSLIHYLGTSKDIKKENLGAIIAVNMAPIFFGFFQMVYPDAPSDSLGFTIACVIIYTFLMFDYEKQVTELENLRNRLNTALDSAESANKAKTTFLFNMSHDIRTPMNAILGFADIAENHIDDKERVADSVRKIRASGSQLLDIINDILEMSRIDSGKMEIREVPADIYEVMDNVMPMLESLAINKSIDLVTDYKNIKDRFVFMDVNHFNRVLTNIVTNAIKYTNSGGKTKVTLEETSVKDGVGNYRLTISDTGIGMSKEFMEHLFEQFSRERSSTVSKQQGTGLGLAITKSIVDAMNGKIEVESEQGKGSTFTFDLPFRIETEIEVTMNHNINMINSEDDSFDAKGKKVLLVEDNELNREIGTEILQDLGFEVDTVQDGELAVETVTEKGTQYYDYILMDIQMPVMDGFEATKRIRKLPDGRDAIIIALSANAFEEDRKRSKKAGMNEHIAKPIEVKVLMETFKKYAK